MKEEQVWVHTAFGDNKYSEKSFNLNFPEWREKGGQRWSISSVKRSFPDGESNPGRGGESAKS